MDLTPELLLEAKFAPARRGYDMNEVDDFLERCAEGLDVLLARLRAEFERAERAEAALAERHGGSMSAEAPAAAAPAEPAAPEPVADAPALAEPVAPASPPQVEEPMRILIAAERTAEAAIADARAEAERIRSEAESVASTTRSEAETMLARARTEAEAEARQAGEEARRAIESEVLALREDRDLLSEDVTSLRRWLDEQRNRLRTTARDLQRLIDDPDGLREVPPPEVHGAVAAEAPEGAAPDADDRADDDAGDEIDARGEGPVQARLEGNVFDADDGDPTQAVPPVQPSGPVSFFDDERAPTTAAFNGSDAGH